MTFQMSDEETSRGYVNLTLLPEQAERLEDILSQKGLTLSGPTIFDRAEGPVRCISLSDAEAEALRKREEARA